MKERILLFFLIIVFILFNFYTCSYGSDVATFEKYDPKAGITKKYSVYYDSNIKEFFAIDTTYSTYVTIRKGKSYYALIVNEPEKLVVNIDNKKFYNSLTYSEHVPYQFTVRQYVFDSDLNIYFPIGTYGSFESFNYNEIIYTVSDLYDIEGNLYKTASNGVGFLRGNLFLARQLQSEHKEQTIVTSIINLCKILVPFLVCLLGVRKAIRFLFGILRSA